MISKAFYYILRFASFLFEAIAGDPQVVDYLVAKGFPLAWLSQGKEMVKKAQGLRTRRDEVESAARELTGAIRRLFRALAKELGDLRFAAWRACSGNPGLALALGVARLPHPKEATAEPAAANGGKKPRKRPRSEGPYSIVTELRQARTMLAAALQSPEAVEVLAPYGYGREEIETLLGRVNSLAQTEMEHERMKASVEALSEAAREATEEFRRFFTPWRRRLLTALSDRPDLRRMVQKTV